MTEDGEGQTRGIRALVWALFVLLLCAVTAALIGATNFTPGELWDQLFGHGSAESTTILLAIRLPRIAVAALCGGSLAAAGVLSQGLFRNALASPSVIGTEAGASLAAATVFLFGAAHSHWPSVTVAAFGGALLVSLIIAVLASGPKAVLASNLLLTGFALNALAGALTSLIVSLAMEDYDRAAGLLHWLMGGLSATGWEHAKVLLPTLVLGLLIAWRLAPQLDVVALGEDVARSLSVDTLKLRRHTILAIALLVGGAVAVAGGIPFIGLVVPHISRLFAGPRHRPLLLLSVINGMSLLVLTDLAARTLRAPSEIDVGILTALFGAPFFLWLLLSRRTAEAA